MGATAEDRLFKRRINEMEQEIKRLQRELQKLKQMRRSGGRNRKELERALQREIDLQDVFDELASEQFKVEEKPKDSLNVHKCRREGCWSTNTTEIQAGTRCVVVCGDCGGRYTINLQGLSFAKTG